MSNPDTNTARQAFAALPPTVIVAEAPWPSPTLPPVSVTTAGIAAAASLAAWSGDDPAAILDRHPEAGLVHCPDHGVARAARSSATSEDGPPNDRCGHCHRRGDLSDRS